MDWMQFIIGLLDKLVWPAVVVFVVVLLRKPLTQLVPLLKKLKYKELEFEFGRELKAVSKHAAGAFPELKRDQKTLLIASADHLPNAAILESWAVVDDAAERLIRTTRRDIDLNVTTRYKLLQDLLIKDKWLDTKKSKLFDELRQLRNKVAHAVGYEVGTAEAIQYIELCFTLVEHFNTLIGTADSSAPVLVNR
ncbi:hypothetical protein [Bowmanella pacifica]|uniref:DUF4145 domain-containing protein n=1 Tax=Bowmanella pacifica TaxID=502051 RepID=A0A918DLV5_9ALTE|nr:hypothetical protein [Bowmanella pacifica]GGO73111.1 hypothetical protein GCM10010982_32880 [Bowmanella pacifica]